MKSIYYKQRKNITRKRQKFPIFELFFDTIVYFMSIGASIYR